MNDAKFKALSHPIGNNKVATRGTAVATGYKPDITVRDEEGNLTYILESEQKTDRKAFLGDLLKAEMYAEQQQAKPALVIVMQPQDNTTTQQIATHLSPYIKWLARKQGGNLNLTHIHILSDADYTQAIAAQEYLDSAAFLGRGHVLLGAE